MVFSEGGVVWTTTILLMVTLRKRLTVECERTLALPVSIRQGFA